MKITRDNFTWISYALMGYYAYFVNGLGPVMPFLRNELKMSYTVSSLHLSAFAVGVIIAGILCERTVRRFGRRSVFWNSALGMAAGVILFVLGKSPIVTIIASLIMGTIGSFVFVTVIGALSGKYGDKRAVALSEANTVGSLCAVVAPVSVGLFVQTAFGWRAAFVLVVILFLFVRFVFNKMEIPEKLSDSDDLDAKKNLPPTFWLYWTIIVLSVSAEFCLIFWSSTFLEVVKNFSKADAALMMSLFLWAMLLGRLVGSRLSHYVKGRTFVYCSAIVGIIGFSAHWYFSVRYLTLTGLFVAGLGVSNLYPQTLSLAVGTTSNIDLASARASLASGFAILTLPLCLGGVADIIGLKMAYAVPALIFILIGISLYVANYLPGEKILIKR